ncbi:hypothetical protein BaRGS_00013109 [Batillaria attramentaria]|uniref:Uncharacterized protein n=1 Tax=Batillaria attramentaria TaxID=370345 RepID=A0ABD0L872_9CAEN
MFCPACPTSLPSASPASATPAGLSQVDRVRLNGMGARGAGKIFIGVRTSVAIHIPCLLFDDGSICSGLFPIDAPNPSLNRRAELLWKKKNASTQATRRNAVWGSR